MNAITRKLIVWLAAVAFGLFPIIAAVKFSLKSQMIDAELTSQLQNIALRLETSLPEAIAQRNTAWIHDTLRAQFPGSNLLAVSITDTITGESICSLARRNGELVHKPNLQSIDKSGTVSLVKVLGKPGAPPARLELIANPDPLRQSLVVDRLGEMAEDAIIVLGLGVVFAVFISLYLAIPLDHLRQMMTSARSVLDREASTASLKVLADTHMDTRSALFPSIDEMGDIFFDTLSDLFSRQEETQMKEENLRVILNSIGDAVVATDTRGSITRLNPSAELLLGTSELRLFGQPLANALTLESSAEKGVEIDPVALITSANDVVKRTSDSRLVARSGRSFDVSWTGSPIRNERGETLGIVLVFRDVSDERRILRSLAENKRFTDSIIESLPGLFLLYQLRTAGPVLIQWNKNTESVTGFCQNALTISPPEQLFCGESSGHLRDALKRLDSEGEIGIELRVRPESSAELEYFFTVRRSQNGSSRLALCFGLDITQRKQSEEAARASRDRVNRQRNLLAQLAVNPAISRGALDTALNDCTRSIANGLNVDRASIWRFTDSLDAIICIAIHSNPEIPQDERLGVGATVSSNTFPGYFEMLVTTGRVEIEDTATDPRATELMASYIEPLGIRAMLDCAIRQQGRIVGIVSMECQKKPRHWHADEEAFASSIAALVGQAFANAERSRALIELEHTRNHLYQIINAMPSAIVGVDTDLRVTHWNNEARRLTGVENSQAVGQPIDAVCKTLKPHRESIKASIERQERFTRTRLPTNRNGQSTFEDITIYPVEMNQQRGAVIRIDDVTEKVRLEELMIQSEKMLSVGGMAAGMAHEINNPLAGLMQTAQVVQARLDPDNQLAANQQTAEELGISLDAIAEYMRRRGIFRMLQTINESGRRMAAIVDNVLSFSRKGTPQKTLESINPLVERTLELAATDYNLKKHHDFRLIRINRQLADDLPQVPCEKGKLQQVLLNLFRNAADAMQTAGTPSPVLTVSTRYKRERAAVHIEVSDNGPGIPEDLSRRIFEPFFTTKSNSGGVGLGLSVSYFIIREIHGGEMTVSSNNDGGTTFTITLPIQTAQPLTAV